MRLLTNVSIAPPTPGLVFKESPPVGAFGGKPWPSEDYTQMMQKMKEWQGIKAKGCVPSETYCDDCTQANICDASCYFLPVCGKR
jgi:hypothetical protein